MPEQISTENNAHLSRQAKKSAQFRERLPLQSRPTPPQKHIYGYASGPAALYRYLFI